MTDEPGSADSNAGTVGKDPASNDGQTQKEGPATEPDTGRLIQALRLVLVALGLSGLGLGLVGLLTHPRPTNPPNSLLWLVGGFLAHDVLVAPAAIVLGFVLARLVPLPYRAVVQGALFVSASVAAASLPLWRGYGGAPGNPTVNPLPYGRNLLIVLCAVWLAAALVMLARWWRGRSARSAGPSPATSPSPSAPR